jgi:aryl sulfotransferase
MSRKIMNDCIDATCELNAWGRAPLAVCNHTIDSRRWVGFSRRAGDVYIASWAKSGTTWLQQIVAQLVFGSGTNVALNKVSPWLENRFVPRLHTLAVLESQEHKRFVKTHLPANALPYRADARYIYIARDGRDAVWSWHNHHMNLRPQFYQMMRAGLLNGTPPLTPPTLDQRRFFLEWLDGDGYPLWPFWTHVKSWWDLRHLPNVLVLHYFDLKSDLLEGIRKIASFIDVDVDVEDLTRIAECCTFSYMKSRAEDLLPEFSRAMNGGAKSFIHRGSGGAWMDVLTPEDICRYESQMLAAVGAECARWLSRPYSDQKRSS